MIRKLFLILLVAVVIIAVWEWITFPNVAELANKPPATTAFMEQRKAELRAEGQDDHLEYRWTPYGNISPYLRRAVLVAEDNDFYEHGGVDVKAMREALLDQLARQRGDVERSADRGQDEQRRQRRSAWSIWRAASWASLRIALRYCDRSKNGSVIAAQTGRPPR